MALTKRIITDKIESTRAIDHYILSVREAIQVLEDDKVISQSFKRYSLSPNHDVSTISDPVVLAQFNAVMTSEVKQNYQTFLEAQNAELNPK
jgi:hypothetical protein